MPRTSSGNFPVSPATPTSASGQDAGARARAYLLHRLDRGACALPQPGRLCGDQGGLGGFAQSLRLDLSASGVRVTEIVAGRVESPLYKDVLSARGARAAMYAGNTAVQPEDVAAMVHGGLGPAAACGCGAVRYSANTSAATPQVPASEESDMKGLSVVIVGGGAGLGALLARMAVEDGASGLGIIDLNARGGRGCAGTGARRGLAGRLAAACDIRTAPAAQAAFARVAADLAGWTR